MFDPENPIGLTEHGCRARQQRLRDRLAALNLDAALITEPPHVMYLTNNWGRVLLAPTVYLPADGPVVLVNHTGPADHLVADEVIAYETDHIGTLVDDQPTHALDPLLKRIGRGRRIGCDRPSRSWLLDGNEIVDLVETVYKLRRRKDADEVEMLRHAVHGVEAAFAAGREFIEPGVTEVQIYAHMMAAAINRVGEPIGEFGNDFQAGSPGGPPRNRPVQAGQLMPLDIGVVVRSYCADLCRTFSVDRNPTDAQCKAHELVTAALSHAEGRLKPGTSCKGLFEEVHAMLNGQSGWSFFHHLGHGIGLFPHERPRINSNWNDTFEVGDTFTLEPGIYHEDLQAGIRIEHNYVITETGFERLSSYPIDL